GTQGGDGELVEVVCHGDPGAGRAQVVELLANRGDLPGEVATVDADGTEARSCDLDGQVDCSCHVVGVDEQGGSGAQGGNLCSECVLLAVVQERERVRGGTHRRHPPGATSLEVAGGTEAGDVGGSGGGHRAVLTGAAG